MRGGKHVSQCLQRLCGIQVEAGCWNNQRRKVCSASNLFLPFLLSSMAKLSAMNTARRVRTRHQRTALPSKKKRVNDHQTSFEREHGGNFGQVRAVASIATLFLIQTHRRLRTRIERGYKRSAACANGKVGQDQRKQECRRFRWHRFPSFPLFLIVVSYRKSV